MKLKLQHLILCLAMVGTALNINAQKYGYLNSTELLAQLPEVKAADSQLQAYQSQLITKGEQMVKDLEAKFQKFSQEADAGTLSQIQIQQKQGELELDQQAIAKYEQEVQQKLLTKREELYKPILDKVKTTLDALAKEQGYTMIFDSGSGGLLHAGESNDLMDMMKAKLGI